MPSSAKSPARTGNDKCALMFEIEHQPGALADAMNVFKRNRLNLTWIESFPIARPEGGYMFFVELEGHEVDARVRQAIAALERKAVRLEVLGSYAKWPPSSKLFGRSPRSRLGRSFVSFSRARSPPRRGKILNRDHHSQTGRAPTSRSTTSSAASNPWGSRPI